MAVPDRREMFNRLKDAEKVVAAASFVFSDFDNSDALIPNLEALQQAIVTYDKIHRIHECEDCDVIRTAYEGGGTFPTCEPCTDERVRLKRLEESKTS